MEQENIKKLKTPRMVLLVLIFVVIIAILVIVNYARQTRIISSYYSFSDISEWTTLECYYNNVAEKREPADNFLTIGYKKYWLEYTTVVKIGVDASKIEISKPNIMGRVKIYVPPAEIISVDDKNSTMKLIKDTGLFTEVTSEEQNATFNEEIKKLRENASRDENLLEMAHKEVEYRLKNYITSIGAQLGKKYTVEFLKEPTNKNKIKQDI